MARVEHVCRDGSPFPVEFAGADDHLDRWFLDREHAPDAMTPLAAAVRRLGRPGQARAYAACGVTRPAAVHRRPPGANGYEYNLGFDLSPAEQLVLDTELRDLARRHGGALGVWEERCLPEVRPICAALRDAPTTTPFATLAEQRDHVWGLTAVAGMVARRDERAVATMCEPRFGGRAGLIAYELAQGFENETTTADRAVERIARAAPGSAEEVAGRSAFLTAYGARAVSWTIDHPTFHERPDLLDAQVALLRRHLVAIGADPASSAADRRRALAAEVEASLPDADERDRFRRRLDRLSSFVAVREARAHWQLVASGAMRSAVRGRGRDLVGVGIIDEADDVFYLTPDEYDVPVGDLRPLIGRRRTEHRHWLAITPPPVIGATDGVDASPVPAPAPTATSAVLHGVAGGGGTAEGPARVILDLADVDRVEPGDVLVATMTSPAWTPLFALAAAVVTDAGDALSHVAIAAREYGIPCVAGTNVATVAIADGTHVVVDGDAGTVTSYP